ncbi:DUF3180 family protein [Kocuria koreensis]|jgi:hypothetical protein|uniref:DUF3180 family protein n=1 Tax=Rothia koreensis TaxID=592378 RepID=A0A7K1LGY3_9MICC|nr:DUF3180 domain-containing protein [Rothia koreensis]MUN54449.1 DUF3180 family protein [Rothia koreensis]
MKPLRYRWLALIAAVALAAGGLATGIWPDFREVGFILPWPTLAVSVLLAAAALALGWKVRAHVKDPKHKPIEPIVASRIAVLAQTCAVYGALLFGWAAGIVAYELALLRFRPASDTLLLSLANVVVGAMVCIAGCLAETWCKRPPDDSDRSESDQDVTTRRGSDQDIPEGEGGYARNRRD